MVKTSRGLVNREITGDGRESSGRWAEREMYMRKQTKTKKKRQKKDDKEFMYLASNL